MEAEKPNREETYPVKLETQRRAGDISRLDYISGDYVIYGKC